jgi:hypothetical protein
MSRRESLFLRPAFIESNKAQDIPRDETAYGARAVDGNFNGFIRTEQEARGLDKFSILFTKCTGLHTGRFHVHAIGNRVGESQFSNKFFCLVEGVHGTGNDFDSFILEIFKDRLKISQLLTAKWSPVSTIEQKNSVSFTELLRNPQRFSGNEAQFHFGEKIIGIQKVRIQSGHGVLLSLFHVGIIGAFLL